MNSESDRRQPEVPIWVWIFLFAGAASASEGAEEYVVSVVDGLGRPVAEAQVEVYWVERLSSEITDIRQVRLGEGISGKDGVARVKSSGKGPSHGEAVQATVSKSGYADAVSLGIAEAIVLRRTFLGPDVTRIAALPADSRLGELRELWAGDFIDEESDLWELVFIHEASLRPGLRALVSDPDLGILAGKLLAFIGVPEDIRFFLNQAPPPRVAGMENRWAYFVATALLEPSTEPEWAFLRICATNGYDDRWVDAGAIQTLMLMATPQSKALLEETLRSNSERDEYLRDALRYVDSQPKPLSSPDVVAAGENLA
ncbi:MAG: hypothetical protein ABL994_24850, partial [Verrucomicrobiales bacterium]